MSTTAEHPTIEDLVFEFSRLHMTACQLPMQTIADGLMLLVHNAIKLLADEAGREADALREKTNSYTASEQAKTLVAMEYWLRQKAEEGQ